VKVFVSTILFVLALSISKCSVLLFLHQLANNTAQRLGLIIIGFVVVIWTLGVMTGIVFECEMPRPWEIWTGKCIPLVRYGSRACTYKTNLISAAVLDHHHIHRHRHRSHPHTPISSHGVDATARLPSEDSRHHDPFFAHFVRCHNDSPEPLANETSLIATSSLRLAYLKDALSPSSDPTFASIPYAITTQIHSALSIILSCTLTLKPLTTLLYAARSQSSLARRPSKHWSGSTIGIGGTPYESYSSFSSKSHIIQEPLHTIQRSMSTPNSPVASNEDIILPEILLPARYAKAPPRPPPPSDAERPDLSMFTQTTCLRPVPVVTNLNGKMWGIGRNKSLVERGLA
jgi:hypothetical protein